MSEQWCTVCCTRHEHERRCPGELLATDVEGHGWRVSVQAGTRTEEYGVLVAPAGEIWRARILTYPNMLWSVPGSRGTMKFAGGTAAEAERRARDYIVKLCAQRSFKLSEVKQAPPSRPLTHENAENAEGGAGPEGRARHLHSIIARFGEEKPVEEGATADMSSGGMFIITNRPLPTGRTLKIVLEMDNATLPLNGVVAWIRTRPEDGRQAGMGVELTQPPALYEYYVRKLS